MERIRRDKFGSASVLNTGYNLQAAQVKEAEVAFKEAFKLYTPGRLGMGIWRMYAHMKQVRYQRK